MDSPPDSPSHLQGASRTTGGILHGRALGNVYNLADNTDFDQQPGRIMGKVHIYTNHGNPDDSHPHMSLKHEVTGTLAPVLEKLGTQYSPVKSMYKTVIECFEPDVFQRKISIYLCMKMTFGLSKVDMGLPFRKMMP